jgi:hypothetical protein
VQCSTRVSALRREPNSHNAAKPQFTPRCRFASRPTSARAFTCRCAKRADSGRRRLRISASTMQHAGIPAPNTCLTALPLAWAAIAWSRARVTTKPKPSCRRRITCAERESPQPTAQQLQNQPLTRRDVSRNPVLPNPSLKLTRYSRPPWPGLGYAVHSPSPSQGALLPRAA